MSTELKDLIKDEETPSSTPELVLKYGMAIGGAVLLWLSLLNAEVAEVYLDEEFHVRQAIVYADNQFSKWDPKITTPPGIYLVAYPWLHLLRLLRFPGTPQKHLRALNALSLLALWYVAWCLSDAIQAERHKLRRNDSKSASEAEDSSPEEVSAAKRQQTTAHVALNIVLFPLLFFFSALFYTDVLSALCVLLAHVAFYKNKTLWVFVASSASLLFRQTNIFWTAVYLGGLETQRQLHRLSTARRGRQQAQGLLSWFDVWKLSWVEQTLYDPEAPEASVEEYLKCGFSLALAALSNLSNLILPLAPYILVLVEFTAFVFLNGGVVLGDKSNHVASIHLPQMLYIWPCFAFFSFATLVPNCLLVMATTLRTFRPSLVREWNIPDAVRLPRLWVLTVFCVLAIAAVHFNTIVHPFILADNRHYTFYVFRLLLRHPAIKYAVTPIYIFCAWLCLSIGITGFDARKKAFTSSLKTSVMLIWLLATTASLATAPLVEPRYFIVPWLIWRLNLHIPAIEDAPEWDENEKGIASVEREFLGYETNWYVIINLAVTYIFLYWRFEWPQQPGQVMRFMW